MNWFERYAIPGLYFVLLSISLYWILFSFDINQKTVGLMASIIITASLPIGYILSIISLRIHYWRPKSWQLHRKAWYNNCPEPHEMSEEEIEAKVAILGRWKVDEIKGKDEKSQVDAGRWLQEWFTKRMDVLAINGTIILATILTWILFVPFVFVANFSYCIELIKSSPKLLVTIFLFFISVSIVLCMISCTNLLNKKISYALNMFYPDLKKIDKAITKNSSNKT